MASESIHPNHRQLKTYLARAQLGTALDLFIKDKDPISVHALACGGCELIEGVAKASGRSTLSTHILDTHPYIDMKRIHTLRNQHWNAIKHFYNHDRRTERDDTALLADFSDHHNDTPLFMGWFDYAQVTGRLPIAAQVFQVWWYALNEEKLSQAADLNAIRRIFPSINGTSRSEQKRRMRLVIAKYHKRKDILADPRTERLPLSISSLDLEA